MATWGGSNQWPPSSLRGNADVLASECEQLEVAGNDDVSLLVIQIAALLYLQDFAAVRHLYRRHADNPALRKILEPWKSVALCALQGDTQGSVGTLFHEVKTQQPLLVPEGYVDEIANSFRDHILRRWLEEKAVNSKKIPPYYATLLGFSSEQEFQQYLLVREGSWNPPNSQPSQVADTVAFFESRMPSL